MLVSDFSPILYNLYVLFTLVRENPETNGRNLLLLTLCLSLNITVTDKFERYMCMCVKVSVNLLFSSLAPSLPLTGCLPGLRQTVET